MPRVLERFRELAQVVLAAPDEVLEGIRSHTEEAQAFGRESPLERTPPVDAVDWLGRLASDPHLEAAYPAVSRSARRAKVALGRAIRVHHPAPGLTESYPYYSYHPDSAGSHVMIVEGRPVAVEEVLADPDRFLLQGLEGEPVPGREIERARRYRETERTVPELHPHGLSLYFPSFLTSGPTGEARDWRLRDDAPPQPVKVGSLWFYRETRWNQVIWKVAGRRVAEPEEE